jgi:hypothetical protein
MGAHDLPELLGGLLISPQHSFYGKHEGPFIEGTGVLFSLFGGLQFFVTGFQEIRFLNSEDEALEGDEELEDAGEGVRGGGGGEKGREGGKERKGKERKGKGREGKGREGSDGREGKG